MEFETVQKLQNTSKQCKKPYIHNRILISIEMEINVCCNIILQEYSYAAIQVIKIQFSVMHSFTKLHKSDGQ